MKAKDHEHGQQQELTCDVEDVSKSSRWLCSFLTMPGILPVHEDL